MELLSGREVTARINGANDENCALILKAEKDWKLFTSIYMYLGGLKAATCRTHPM